MGAGGGEREQNILFSLAAERYWRRFSTEAHTSLFLAPKSGGGWEWRGSSKRGEGKGERRRDVMRGPILPGSQPKSRTHLMGSSLLCDLISEN